MKKPWVRVVLATSLDGRISLPQGGASQLGTIKDREVLEESLAWSDGALLGGGTLRAHKSTCLIHKTNLIKNRLKSGRSKQPISLIISNKKKHELDWPFFQQPIRRWLISTKQVCKDNSHLPGYERHIYLKNKLSDTLKDIHALGVSKLVVLGGGKIIGFFFESDQIDEIQLTIIPKILGGEHLWIPHTLNNLPISLSQTGEWILRESFSLGNSELLVRYVRNRKV